MFAALLFFYPNANYRPCLEARRDRIEIQAAEAAEENHVPVGVLLVIGWVESHNGCNPRSGGCWGAPIDRNHRLTAGRAGEAAHSLRMNFDNCHTWEGAISAFRSGSCHTLRYRKYVTDVLWLIERAYAHVDEPLPPDFRYGLQPQ